MIENFASLTTFLHLLQIFVQNHNSWLQASHDNYWLKLNSSSISEQRNITSSLLQSSPFPITYPDLSHTMFTCPPPLKHLGLRLPSLHISDIHPERQEMLTVRNVIAKDKLIDFKIPLCHAYMFAGHIGTLPWTWEWRLYSWCIISSENTHRKREKLCYAIGFTSPPSWRVFFFVERHDLILKNIDVS